MKAVTILLGLCLTLMGCSNSATVQSRALSDGTQRSFDAPYDAVARAVVAGLAELKLAPSMEEDVPEGHVVMVARHPHGMSWGEVGRILVVRDSKPVVVRVVYEKRVAFTLTSNEASFSRNLFAAMDRVLGTQSPKP